MEEIFIKWENRYTLGIPLLDDQHKELVRLTNSLYEVCRQGETAARETFGNVLHAAVGYVVFHFGTEEQIMDRISYPALAEHKREHESFVKKVLEDKNDFEGGKRFVPYGFVRFLRDWVLSHIAVYDRLFVDYIQRLKKEGVMNLP